MDLLLCLNASPVSRNEQLHKRVASAVREAILDGRLKPGQPMPSTRRLAELSNVCRATVLKAYEELEKAGLIKTAAGKRAIVCNSTAAPDSSDDSEMPGDTCNMSLAVSTQTSSGYPSRVSTFVQLLGETTEKVNLHCLPASQCSTDAEFRRRWTQVSLRSCRREMQDLLSAEQSENRKAALKAMLAGYLFRSRAIGCKPDQLFLTTSNQYALYHLARMLVRPGSQILLGCGSSPTVRDLFLACGAQLLECPLDKDGIDFDTLRTSLCADAFRPNLIYVNPSSHQPTGEVMSLTRRLKLLAIAEQFNAFIIEDDIDSEFYFGRQPIPSMQSLSKNDRVFYLSSIAQLLSPFTNLAVLAVPARFVSMFRSEAPEDEFSSLSQSVLMRLVSRGDLEVYVKHKRRERVRRKQSLIYSMTLHMFKTSRIVTHGAGNRQVLRINSDLPVSEILGRGIDAGLKLSSTSDFYGRGSNEQDVAIFLDELDEEILAESVRQWAEFLGRPFSQAGA